MVVDKKRAIKSFFCVGAPHPMYTEKNSTGIKSKIKPDFYRLSNYFSLNCSKSKPHDDEMADWFCQVDFL